MGGANGVRFGGSALAKFVLALVIQIVIMAAIFYLDAKQTVEQEWSKVLRFALNPLVVLAYGLVPLAFWWTSRVIYQQFDRRFWAAAVLEGLIAETTHLSASWYGCNQVPSSREAIALTLTVIAVALCWQPK